MGERKRTGLVVLGGVLGGLVVTGVARPWMWGTEAEPAPVAEVVQAVAAPGVAPTRRTVKLLRPVAEVEERAAEAPRRIEVAELEPAQRTYHDVVMAKAQADLGTLCIQQYLAEHGIERDVEVGMQTVVDRQGLAELRVTYADEIDDSVEACLDQVAWSLTWSQLPLEGELVQEMTFVVGPPARALSDAEWDEAFERQVEAGRSAADSMAEAMGLAL